MPLGGKGTPREVIRSYLLNGFYADHCKIYQKRPIYWLFSSGKKNGFKALVYMHRWERTTVATVRTDYVHELQERYRTQLSLLSEQIDSVAQSDRVKLKKRQEKLTAQLTEINTYEEKVHHLADMMIDIDLDDGVKVNLCEICGHTGEDQMTIDNINRSLAEHFAKDLPDCYDRRIIFWFDSEREFESMLDELDLTDVKILKLTGDNFFEAKMLLSETDTQSNYLVYDPLTYKKREDNWLRDIQLYSEEFRADLVSMQMNELKMPQTTQLRRAMKHYKKFFESKERVGKLAGTRHKI